MAERADCVPDRADGLPVRAGMISRGLTVESDSDSDDLVTNSDWGSDSDSGSDNLGTDSDWGSDSDSDGICRQ